MKTSKKLLCVLLSVLMVMSIVPLGSVTVSAADTTHTVSAETAASRTATLVNSLVGKYFTTTGKSCGNSKCDACKNSNVIATSWLKSAMGLVPDSVSLLPEHYYSSSGYVTSTAWSCAGFANYCLWYIYAQNSSDNVRMVKIYSGTFNKANMDSSGVRTGDVIRVDDHHSFIYISHNSTGVTVLDSNWDSSNHNSIQKHTISWTWRSGTTMAITRGKNWTGTHTHAYSGSYYEAAHPHRIYQKCSCGATKYTGANKTLSSCTQCTLTVDSKYNTVKGFKAYPCVSSKFEVKTSDLSTRGGEIYVSDYCTINQLYTNGWCQVTFPMDSGGTRTAYTQISNFIKSPSTALTKYTATEYIDLFSTSAMSTKLYRIYPGDVCYTIGKSGSATQIFMPLSSGGGYVLGWAVLPPAQESCGYSVPFKCRTISTSKVKCYDDINFTSSPGYIYPEDDCVITAVYSNGKVKLTCPWTGGTTKTVYVNKSVFINSSTTPVSTKAPKYAKTYLRTDMSTNIGWIDAGDSIQIVATSGTKTQIIYPADVGKRCGWVNTSDLTQTYKVTFNANGGTGAPSAQTKTHAKDLTLSSTKPTRTGYTFVGWATSASSTTVAYSAGSVYSKDAAITLYAVWRKQSFTITFNANGGTNAPAVQSQTYGDAVTVTSSKPSKLYSVNFDANEGVSDTHFYSLECTFVSWNTKADGSGISVKAGASYTPNANVTLYAIYSNPTLADYPIPTREGYVFNGWYSAKTGGNIVELNSTITSNTNLYAQWEKETYSVIYYDDGSLNIPNEQYVTFGDELVVSSTVPQKTGYEFAGWSTEESSTAATYLPGKTYSINSSLILYPVWEKEAVVVSSIEIESMPNKTTYQIGDSFDATGLIIKVNYSDGSSESIAKGFSAIGFSSSTSGEKTITVLYDQKQVEFVVNVIEEVDAKGNYSISNASGDRGASVDVYVSISNNPGIISLRNTITYDMDALELVEVQNIGLLEGYTAPSSDLSSPYTLRWADSLANSNNAKNGNIVKLTFKIKDTASYGSYQISVNHVEARTYNGAKVSFEDADSIISVNNSNVSVSGVSLDSKSLTIGTGERKNLSVNVTPANATNKALTWSSSNSNIVSVDGLGNIVALKNGSAIITVRTADGNYTDSCSITVVCLHINQTNYPEKKATCVEDGYSAYSICNDCGKVSSKTTYLATGHKYDSGEITKNPTCNETGVRTYRCANCSNTKTETISVSNHLFVTQVTPASCTENGYTTYLCSKCGYTYESDFRFATGHNHKVNKVFNPTCTDQGYSVYKCANCDDSFESDYTDAKGHDYLTTYVEETEFEAGYEKHTCKECGFTYSDNYTDPKGHNHKIVKVVPATCVNMGYTVYTCDCGDTYNDNYVDVLEHNYNLGIVTKPATCSEVGIKTYTCMSCGSIKNETIPKEKHITETILNKATTSKNGNKVTKCTVCGTQTAKSTIYYPKTITLSATSYTYDGKVKKPTVKVVDANGKTIATSNYTVTYSSGLKNVGKYTVKITFKGNYSGTVSKTFTIVPKSTTISSLTALSKGFTVKWKKQATQTTGYQVQIATDSGFTKGVKNYTVSSTSTVSKKITKLTGGKKYYVRIRTYKTVNGTKYYSSWSAKKYVTTKK